MTITSFLLQTSFSSNSSLHQRAFLPSYSSSSSLKPIHSIQMKSTIFCGKLTANIVTIVNDDKPKRDGSRESANIDEKLQNSHDELFWRSAIQKTSAATGALLGLLFLFDHGSALAASGGRMGGSSFSSSSRSSGSSRSSSSSSWPSLPSYSSSSRSSSPSYSSSSFSDYFTSYSAPPSYRVQVSDDSLVWKAVFFVGLVCIIARIIDINDSNRRYVYTANGLVDTATYKISVVKVQVGLLGMARSLQKDLNGIAETADTSTSEGLRNVLTESILALLRHPEYCVLGHSSVDVKKSIEEGEAQFNRLCVYERANFDEETLVNVNSKRKKKKGSARTTQKDGLGNEYIVMTIMVAAEGISKVPSINANQDLQEALQSLASIPSSKIKAVEVSWTPQNENDILSEQELREKYPLLRPL